MGRSQATKVENSTVHDQTMKPGNVSGEGTRAERRWREKIGQSGIPQDNSRELRFWGRSTSKHVSKSKTVEQRSATLVEPQLNDQANGSKPNCPDSVGGNSIAEERWRKKVQKMAAVHESKSGKLSTPKAREIFHGRRTMMASLEGDKKANEPKEAALMRNNTAAPMRNNTEVSFNQRIKQSPAPVIGHEGQSPDRVAGNEERYVSTGRTIVGQSIGSDSDPKYLAFEAELSPDVEFGPKIEAIDVSPIDDSPPLRCRDKWRLCFCLLLVPVAISVGLAIGLNKQQSVCEYKSNWSLLGERIIREGIFGEIKVVAENMAYPTTGAFGSSVSVSGNGERLAVARRFGDSFSVFELNDTGNWIQLGSDIRVQSIELDEAELFGDPGQGAVVISGDGNRIAVGIPFYNDKELKRRGGVMVFEHKDEEWVQIGKTLLGESEFDYLGDKNAVDLSEDGNIVTIGNSRRNNSSGCVRVYQLIAGEWAQLGNDIEDDTEGSHFGQSVSMSADGMVVSIGASRHNDSTGVVRVFKYSEKGNWIQMGNNIYGGKGHCLFGWPISISSDASRLAVSSTSYLGENTVCSDTNFDSDYGEVRVFDYSGGNWTQMGEGFVGTELQETFGWSISLSGDGTTLAIGNSGSKINGENAGYSRAYRYACGTWAQVGNDIVGAMSHDWSGFSVGLSYNGERLAVGNPRDYGVPGNETVAVFSHSW